MLQNDGALSICMSDGRFIKLWWLSGSYTKVWLQLCRCKHPGSHTLYS